MPAVSQIDLCNRALARIRAAPIASINENSLEARECRRFYPTVISDMLDMDNHQWSFANTRVMLAEKAVNDRSREWTYAYQMPTNVGSPIRVVPDFESMGLTLPVPLPGQPYAETWALTGVQFETPYIIEGDTLYSSVQNATLEYTIDSITGLNVSSLVETAVEIDLGARLAVPVKANAQRELTLASAARNAWENAVADDRNRHPQQSAQYVSEAMLARQGLLPDVP